MKYKLEISQKANSEMNKFAYNIKDCLIQQTPEWAEIISENGKDESFFLIVKNEADKIIGLLTVFLYENNNGNIMVSVPSFGGYGGVVADRDFNVEDIYSMLLKSMIELAKEKSCVTITISTAPFFAEESLYDKYFQPDFIKENFFRYFDLREDFWKKLNSKQRNNIKRNLGKAEKNGLQFRFTDDINDFNQWYEIHLKRMDELKALPIPKAFFLSVFDKLEFNNSYWFAVVIYTNKIIGGALFTGKGKTVDIFIQSGDSNYFYTGVNTLLIYEAINYFQTRGVRFLNWQSSPSQSSGTNEFKKNWGTEEKSHRYITKIIGDISNLKGMSVSEVKSAYGFRYVIPYNELERTK